MTTFNSLRYVGEFIVTNHAKKRLKERFNVSENDVDKFINNIVLTADTIEKGKNGALNYFSNKDGIRVTIKGKKVITVAVLESAYHDFSSTDDIATVEDLRKRVVDKMTTYTGNLLVAEERKARKVMSETMSLNSQYYMKKANLIRAKNPDTKKIIEKQLDALEKKIIENQCKLNALQRNIDLLEEITIV